MSKYNFLYICALLLIVFFASSQACVVPDNGTGTADLPPAGCPYQCVDDTYHIIDGLPPGTEILIDGVIGQYFNIMSEPGGSLGGQVEWFNAEFEMPMVGTGQLAGFNRHITIPISCETHSGPRNPGDPMQAFAATWYHLSGQITGDPDFDSLQIVAGTDLGLPSPGQTTLTELPSGDFAVDSFFDITYQIYFTGAPGGMLDGLSGVTTGTVRVSVPPEVFSPIPAGVDFWLTHYSEFEFGGGGLPPIPADFFGPGSDPFDGIVAFKGRPAAPTTNTLADTIIERLDDVIMFDPPDPINIEMLELNLVSTRPIKVTYMGGMTESFFDVMIELDSSLPSTGQMTIEKFDDEHGVFEIGEIKTYLLIKFESVADGTVYTMPITLPVHSVQYYPWQVSDPEYRVRPSCEGPGFYPAGGDVMVLTYGGVGVQEISEKTIPGDTDLDNDVDLTDLAELAQRWLIGI